MPMPYPEYTILILLLLAMLGFIWGYWRYDIVASVVLMLSVLMGAVSYDQVFSGLANPAVITVACVMILSESITASGVLERVIVKFDRLSQYFSLYLLILCLITGFLSAFMNNVGALTLMMPIAIKSAIKNKYSPSKILMPLALASALGGLTTAIGTPPNIIISNLQQQVSGKAFTLFAYAPVGASLAVIGLIFIVLIGWRLLPIRQTTESIDLSANIDDYIFEIALEEGCKFIEMTIDEIQTKEPELTLLGLIRNNKKRLNLSEEEILQEKDVLIIETSPKHATEIVQRFKATLVGHEETKANKLITDDKLSLFQMILAPGASLENKTFKQSRIKSRYQMNLLGISREGKNLRDRLQETRLKAGDILLFNGQSSLMGEAIKRLGLLPLSTEPLSLPDRGLKQYAPILFFVIAVIVSALNLAPIQISFSGAIIFLCLLKIINAQQLYDCIDWPIILLLATMIPLGNALQTSGGTALLSHLFLSISHKISYTGLLLLLLIATMTLSDFMNNAATAIVMGPIALSLASALHLPTEPFLMIVAIGASCSFLTPIGHQNNILVMGPGGYRFSDYLRMGLPIEVLIALASIPLIEHFWPAYTLV